MRNPKVSIPTKPLIQLRSSTAFSAILWQAGAAACHSIAKRDIRGPKNAVDNWSQTISVT